MASPLFNPQNRPKPTKSLAEGELVRIGRDLVGETIIITGDSAPCLFLFASEYGEQSTGEFKVPVPTSWKRFVNKVYLVPQKEVRAKNGSQVVTMTGSGLQEAYTMLKWAFEQEGFLVEVAAPTRFERPDVI